jgi:hypothetical protein
MNMNIFSVLFSISYRPQLARTRTRPDAPALSPTFLSPAGTGTSVIISPRSGTRVIISPRSTHELKIRLRQTRFQGREELLVLGRLLISFGSLGGKQNLKRQFPNKKQNLKRQFPNILPNGPMNKNKSDIVWQPRGKNLKRQCPSIFPKVPVNIYSVAKLVYLRK